MSKLIEKFKPPVIKKEDLELGVRYLEESPVQKDFLGQEIKVGDLVIYGGTGDRSGNLQSGKVIGIYSKITPPRGYQIAQGTPDRIETSVSVGLLYRWGGSTVKRQSTRASSLVKITEDQFVNKEMLKKLQEA